MRDPNRPPVAALALRLGLAWVGLASPAAATAMELAKDPAPAPAFQPVKGQSEAAAQMTAWVIASGDNGGLPFAVIDKVAAKVFVFSSEGQLLGKAPALIGSSHGDNLTPGDAKREMSAIPMSERTTPAGRFVASFGPASGKQRVLWVDYPTAIALHPVVTANPKERRLQRLKSATPRDNHITHGCINVSAAFYSKVVRPAFTRASGIIYILPETRPMEDVFPTFRSTTTIARNAGAPGASDVAGVASPAGAEAALGK